MGAEKLTFIFIQVAPQELHERKADAGTFSTANDLREAYDEGYRAGFLRKRHKYTNKIYARLEGEDQKETRGSLD